ncbi:MAG: hypothetical protein EOP45_20530 [Sphingobacteriaceae bacterium]|nr:MAG: hypothetical protein EOP45_20530 [Sphingobacteriaceae bacterium]
MEVLVTDVRLLLKGKILLYGIATLVARLGSGHMIVRYIGLKKKHMTFVELFVDRELCSEDIESTVQALFPDLEVFQWDPWAGEVEPTGFNADNSCHLLFDIYKNDKRAEFCWCITIYRVPDIGNEARKQLLAYSLSKNYNTRILIAYSLPTDTRYPYSVLVYNNGECYLANDAMFDYTGDENSEELIEILHPYDLPMAQFNSFGELQQ